LVAGARSLEVSTNRLEHRVHSVAIGTQSARSTVGDTISANRDNLADDTLAGSGRRAGGLRRDKRGGGRQKCENSVLHVDLGRWCVFVDEVTNVCDESRKRELVARKSTVDGDVRSEQAYILLLYTPRCSSSLVFWRQNCG
jgi:hypothetical protein